MGIFSGWGMPEIAAQILIGFLGIFLLISLLMVLDIFLVWVERKVVSRFQDRIGPNRVGPFGLIQPFADIIKLLIKEDITPGGADRVVYNLAPMLSMRSQRWSSLMLGSGSGSTPRRRDGGVSCALRAAASATDSTRWMRPPSASSKRPMVPYTSGWPAWPIRITSRPSRA